MSYYLVLICIVCMVKSVDIVLPIGYKRTQNILTIAPLNTILSNLRELYVNKVRPTTQVSSVLRNTVYT